MKTSVFAFALSSIIGVSAVMPAEAMPVPAPTTVNKASDVAQVRVVVRRGYWRGHRGYRYGRPGYRRHADGFWYPFAVFSPSIVIAPRRHWHWCGPRYNRYRCR